MFGVRVWYCTAEATGATMGTLRDRFMRFGERETLLRVLL